MAEEQKGFRLSRRLLLGAAVVGGAVLGATPPWRGWRAGLRG
ncbi:hypothetical protein [Mesorhizobium sp. B2-4-17]|nr:hypothetical protein [Mesorhizobium sp. B2-4-17]